MRQASYAIPGLPAAGESGDLLTQLRAKLPDAVLLLEGAPDIFPLRRMAFEAGVAHYPIIDFRAEPAAESDIAVAGTGDAAIAEATRRAEPMLARLTELPRLAGRPDSTELQVLAIAYLRDGEMKVAWDPSRPEMVSYPVLTGLSEPRRYLDALADAGLLERIFFDRLHQCASCGSSRLNVREECPSCQAGHLEEESLIHHYRCAYQGLEREFLQGDRLICPKCRRELRHYGVDYDRPGTAYYCKHCSKTASEPVVGFLCADCGAHTAGDAASRHDWHHYRLTGEGRDALLTGRLPARSLAESMREMVPGVLSRRHFELIAGFQRQIAERYERPLSGWRLTVEPAEGAAALGLADRERAFRLVAEVVAQAVRDCDAVTAEENEVRVLMPETDEAGAKVAIERVRKRLEETVAATFSFLVEPIESWKAV